MSEIHEIYESTMSKMLSQHFENSIIVSIGSLKSDKETFLPYCNMSVKISSAVPQPLNTRFSPELIEDFRVHGLFSEFMEMENPKHFTDDEIVEEISKIYVQSIIDELET